MGVDDVRNDLLATTDHKRRWPSETTVVLSIFYGGPTVLVFIQGATPRFLSEADSDRNMTSEIPDSRCGATTSYDREPEEPGSCVCWRETWGNHDLCIWHADVSDKPEVELQEARREFPERLDGAVLRGVELDRRISFDDCVLRDADFSKSFLHRTVFENADLSNVNFSGATLRNVDLSGSLLINSVFVEADLVYSDLRGSDLTAADFSDALFDTTKVEDANLLEADLSGIRVAHTNFSSSQLLDADYDESSIQVEGQGSNDSASLEATDPPEFGSPVLAESQTEFLLEEDIENIPENLSSEEITTMTEFLEKYKQADSTDTDELSELSRQVDKLQSRLGAEKARREEREENVEELVSELRQQREELQDRISRADELEEDISATKEEIDRLREDTSQLVKERVGEALGEEFEKQSEKLEQSMTFWMRTSWVTIVILLATSALIYIDITTGGQSNVTVLSKIALLIPISVAVWFSVSNYSRQRKMMQEYEFKSNIAASLRPFKEMVDDNSEDELVAEFIVETVNKVYSDPLQNIGEANGETQGNQTPVTPGQSSTSLIQALRNLDK